MAAWQGWEPQVLRAANLPITPRNITLLRGWQASEGGTAAYNPLNTTTHEAGSTAYNSNGGTPVQSFLNANDGIRATVKTLYNGHYGAILGALKQGNADYSAFGSAVNASPWGTHGGYIGKWSAGSGQAPASASPAAAGVPHTLQGQVPNTQGIQQQAQTRQKAMAARFMNQAQQYFNAGGKAVTGGTSIADMVAERKQSQAMQQVGAQSGVQFQDETGMAHTNPNAGDVVSMAKQYLGTKYVFGGTTPKGFDCSGFIQYLYAHKGINLPRTTYQQINVGQHVNSMKNLQPGDAVFFATNGDVHHEGMYIGNGQFIHSPHTGDVVKISNISDPYYTSSFVGGRRFM